MHRLIAGTAVAIGGWLLMAGTASADAGGHASTDDGGIQYQVEVEVGAPGEGGSGNDQSRCAYSPLDHPSDATVPDIDGTPIVGDGTGRWYVLECDDELVQIVYFRPVDPLLLAAEAERYLPIPEPRPEFSPPGDQIVNLESWMWLPVADWQQLRATVSVPGVRVSVIAVPDLIEWQPGDGPAVICVGPGTAWDQQQPYLSPTCAHTYSRSSASLPGDAYPVSVTVRWHATWTVEGAPGGGDLGTIDRTTTFSVRVGEVQAVNTRAS